MKCGACGADQLSDKSRFCHQCGAPVVSVAGAMDPFVGKVIGNYQVLSVIGEGGMGKVYRAEQVKLRRPVCLKTLLPQFARDESLVARFEREGVATASMRHPNIVSVYDFGRTDDGTLYIVMELVEGKTVRAVLKEEAPLPVSRALPLMSQVLSALDEAHANNVVHRDLKPSNILVSKLRDGTDLVKVVDFGIAKLLGSAEVAAPGLTRTGMMVGTMGYMAPEQLLGGEVDARSDLYSAGVILWELLTGRKLFASRNEQEVAQSHLTQAAPSPSTVSRLPIPQTLDSLVLKALEKSPDRRFKSALEFRAQLEALRASVETSNDAVLRTTPPRPSPSAEIPAPATSMGLRPPPVPANPGTKVKPAIDLGQLSNVVPEKLLSWATSLPSLAASKTKRPVTLLFAEPAGLAALSTKLDAAEVKATIAALLEGLSSCVKQAGGHAERLPGNTLIATFGLPEIREDDAVRSVFSAMQMQTFTKNLGRQRGVTLGVSIGIHLESIIAGGYDALLDDPAVTEVLNVSRRIASIASGATLISQAVQRAAGNEFVFKERASLQEGSRTLFEVVGTAEAASRADPIAGRISELDTLKALVNVIAQRGAGGLMLVGSAGLGKTRLLDEAETLARARNITVARARGGRFATSGPYDTLRELVNSLNGKTSHDSNRSTLMGLSRFGLAPPELSRLERLFSTTNAKANEEPPTPDQQLLDRAILISLMQKAAAASPLLLAVDDVHLADRASLDVLESLIGSAGKHPMGLIVGARPQGLETLLPKIRRHELKALSPSEVAALVSARLPSGKPSTSMVSLVIDRSQGNPLFAKEIVNSLAEQGALERRGDEWYVQSATALPDSLSLLLSSRLDRLSANARLLLSWGAVCGRTFDVTLVAGSVDSPVDVAAATEECLSREMLAATERSSSSTFTFPQAIVHEHILETLPAAERRHMHQRIAESIERGVSSGAEHPLEAMARHFRSAELPRKAVKYLRASADRFFERNLLAPAGEAYQQCLTLLSADLPKAGVPQEGTVTTFLEVGARAVESVAGQRPKAAVELADKVLAVGAKNQAVSARIEVLRQKSLALARLTRPQDAEAVLLEARSLAEGVAPPALVASLNADYATILEARGDLGKAAEVLVLGLQNLGRRGVKERHLVWQFLNQLGRLHLRLNKLEQAKEYFENARSQAKAAESESGEARVLVNLAVLSAQQQDGARALALLDEAMELSERLGDGIGKARIRYNRGLVLKARGDVAGAKTQFEQAGVEARELGWREGEALAAQALR